MINAAVGSCCIHEPVAILPMIVSFHATPSPKPQDAGQSQRLTLRRDLILLAVLSRPVAKGFLD